MREAIIMTHEEQRIYRLSLEVLHERLSIVEFSTLIGKSYRQAQRIIKKVEDRQMFGVKHGNNNRAPCNKITLDFKTSVMDLLRTKYFDFNLSHFQEKLREEEGIEVGRETLRKWAHEANLVKRSCRRRGRSRVHKPRPRMPRRGMLIQFDGSEHDWFCTGEPCTLIGGVDDATGEIVGLQFFYRENLPGCLQVIHDIIINHGVPEAFYFDQACYFGKTYRDQDHTQIGRILEEMGSKIILARSPQAKGKIERLWGTLQDRLIAELRLKNINNMDDANIYLKNQYIAIHNKKFSYQPREIVSSFKKYFGRSMKELFSVQHKRKISAGNTFAYQTLHYVVDEPLNYRFRTVTIRTYMDGSVSYDINGKPIQVKLDEGIKNRSTVFAA